MMQQTRDAWRRHRVLRAGLILDGAEPETARDAYSESYYELVVAVRADVLLEKPQDRDEILALLLFASGAVSGGEETTNA